MTAALSGVRVLDLTNVLTGPFCAYWLGLLGADAELNKKKLGASFLAQNGGKKSLTLNLKSDAGKEVFRKVVNISSVAGTGGNAGQANYSAGKAGIIGLTKALSKEWGRYKVNVNAVAFGLIKTRLTGATAGGYASIDVEGRQIKVGVNSELMTMMEA